MKLTRKTFLAALAALMMIAAAPHTPAFAADGDPLFVNLTSDDGHRVNMALAFGGAQLTRGHPLTVFINDKAVLTVSAANSDKFAEQQKKIGELLSAGATVIVCPVCMKHYGVEKADLLPGLTIGNPETTGGALFAPNTRTMAW